MGKRSDFKRRKNDAYFTPNKAMVPLLAHLPSKSRFIEPSAGAGAMVDFFQSHGHTCVDYFDIEPARKDVKRMDAFEYPIASYNDADFLITNPMWKKPELFEFIELWASIRPTWLLTDVNWIFSKRASPIVSEYCKKIVAMPRVKWIEDSKHTGTENCMWALYDKHDPSPLEFIPQPH